MVAPLTLPDRQTVRTLHYLVEQLNGDQYLTAGLMPSLSKVVDNVLAKEPTELKGKMLKFHTAGIPQLAFYREGGSIDQNASANNFLDAANFKFTYVVKVPADGLDYSGAAIARVWCHKVWYAAVRHLLSQRANDMCEKAGIRDIIPGKYQLLHWPLSSLAIVDGNIVIQHTEPPYEQDELDDLKKITVALNLYNEAGVDTGYQVDITEMDPNA